MRHVFLNPDGTNPFGLAVIVHASTGVVYENQCDGLNTDLRSIEGFFVPLGSSDVVGGDDAEPFNVERALEGFFAAEFGGHPYLREKWTEQRVEVLAKLVRRVPMFLTGEGGSDFGRTYLELDRSRLDAATEAWVPVQTPYGPATLVFANCD